MDKGKLISFEGLDGCGKSTQIKITKQWLENIGLSVSISREPGGTEIGQQIRSILLNPKHGELSPESELLLYLADRVQHLQELIIPAKSKGEIILCDRSHDSTIAYQGYGRGLNLRSIESIVTQCIKPNAPDFTILLNISPETVEKRLQKRDENLKKDRLDLESLSFFKRVSKGFQSLAYSEPDRYICIDGEKEVEVVHKEIVGKLKQKLNI